MDKILKGDGYLQENKKAFLSIGEAKQFQGQVDMSPELIKFHPQKLTF